MATVSVQDGTLFVELRRWDKILAVHGSLRIPLTHVTAASSGPAPPVPWLRKIVGTNVPGVMAAGTFFDRHGFAFYDYHAGTECLLLEIDHEFYKNAVIEIDPPQTATEAAALVAAALVKARGSP